MNHRTTSTTLSRLSAAQSLAESQSLKASPSRGPRSLDGPSNCCTQSVQQLLGPSGAHSSSCTRLIDYFDEITTLLIPSAAAQLERLRVFEYLRGLIFAHSRCASSPLASVMSS